jgi:hypothetical protein
LPHSRRALTLPELAATFAVVAIMFSVAFTFASGAVVGELICRFDESATLATPITGAVASVTALQVNDLNLERREVYAVSGETPLNFALLPNYPNPFNAETMIRFAVPQMDKKTELHLDIFSLSGQLVRQLYRGPGEPGYHTERWDGRDDRGLAASSAVYVCRLRAGDFVANTKLLLLK